MLPNIDQVHVNGPLTNLSIAYMNAADAFVADRVFPRVPVTKKSDTYFTYDRGDMLRDEMQVRAPGSESAGMSARISSDNYNCSVFSLHYDVDDQTRANADDPLSLDTEAARQLTEKALIKRDRDWASKYFTTSTWTGSSTSADLVAGTDFTAWDDAASTPIEDIKKQKRAVLKKTGVKPNTLVLDPNGFDALTEHPDIVDRIKHTSDRSVDAAIIARLFGIERILVAEGVYNTAAEGVTTSTDFIFGNDALLVYSAPNPGLQTVSGGYTFVWNADGVGSNGQVITSIRVPLIKSDRHEIESNWDHKVVAPLTGAFFSNVATAA